MVSVILGMTTGIIASKHFPNTPGNGTVTELYSYIEVIPAYCDPPACFGSGLSTFCSPGGCYPEQHIPKCAVAFSYMARQNDTHSGSTTWDSNGTCDQGAVGTTIDICYSSTDHDKAEGGTCGHPMWSLFWATIAFISLMVFSLLLVCCLSC